MTVTGARLRPLADELSGPAAQWWGVHVAVVTDNEDPLGYGRVKVRLPWLPDDADFETWARVATMMAGKGRGTWFIPDPEDEVLVAFERGDPSRPVVIGSMWNGVDEPPEEMVSGNPKRTILTEAGVRVTLDNDEGSVLIETPNGKQVHLTDFGSSITVDDASGNSITLDSSGVSIVASSKVAVQGSTVQVDASMVTVNAGMSKFSGVVQCDTLISNAVVSSSYTPGAGNIW